MYYSLLQKLLQTKSIFFIFMIGLVYTPTQAQQTITLDKNFQKQVLTNNTRVKVYQDTRQELDLKQATKLNWDTQAQDLKDPVCIAESDAGVIWLRFNLDVAHPDSYLLTTFNFYGTSVLYYRHSSDSSWQKTILTEEMYHHNRLHEYYFFRQFIMQLKQKGTYECYFRTHGIGAITLFSNQYLEKKQVYNELTFLLISIGALLAITFYNCFLIFATKDRIYIYYSIYQVTNIILGLFFAGVLAAYNLDYTYSENRSGYTNFFFISYLANQLFAYHFLKVPSTLGKAWTRLYILLIAISIGAIIVSHSVGLYYSQMFVESLSVTAPLCLWISGIWAYFKKKRKEARFYIIAYVFYLLGSLLAFLTASGSINTILGYNAFLTGAVFEAIFFSLALGDRISILRKEKEQAQNQNLKLIREQKAVLEQKVQERTAALSKANEDIMVQNQELKSRREEILAQNEELYQSQEEISAQRDALQKTNVTLDRSRRQIELSINSAKNIQQAILLNEYKFQDHFADYFLINRPKDVVSGDFFWINRIQDKLILVAADCTGHGVPGAFMTLIGANLLDNIIRVNNIQDPAAILSHLHTQVKIALHQEETNNNNGMDAVVIALNVNDDLAPIHLTFAGAKNNLSIWSNAELLELKGTRKSIGGIQNEAIQFESQERSLNKGDLLYLGSDGLEDQNNQKRKRFGRKRLKELLIQLHQLPLAQQKQQIETALATHMQGTEQRDDILLIGVKI